MPNRPGNDEREGAFMGSDRERQRAVASEGARSASPTGSNTRTPGSTTGAGNAPGGQRQRSNRGFASMDANKQREIASKGGKAAHAKGTAHEFDSGEAREAGRKGGLAVSRNRDHMAAIGRRGGEARGAARGRAAAQSNTAGSGSIAEGAQQNSRRPGVADREIELRGNESQSANQGVNANPQGARGGSAALGGERRPNNTLDESRESFGNH
jgi:general stress protein YciG